MTGRWTSWRVRRESGLLAPGFTKHFPPGADEGVTRWLGFRVGAFDVVRVGDAHELHYRSWPIVDVLLAAPVAPSNRIASAGYVRLPGRMRLRFCRFRLER